MTTNNSQAVIPVKKGDNITIIGKRWFDKLNGNTYFSAVGLINNIVVVEINYQYGYGDQYIYETYKELQSLGYIPDAEQYKGGGCEAFWSYCERKGISKYNSVSDVKRKKDL